MKVCCKENDPGYIAGKKKRPVLVAENGPKAKKAYPKTSLDNFI